MLISGQVRFMSAPEGDPPPPPHERAFNRKKSKLEMLGGDVIKLTRSDNSMVHDKEIFRCAIRLYGIK